MRKTAFSSQGRSGRRLVFLGTIGLWLGGLAAAPAPEAVGQTLVAERLRPAEALVLKKVAQGERADPLKELVEPHLTEEALRNLIKQESLPRLAAKTGDPQVEALLKEQGPKLRLRADFLAKLLAGELPGLKVHRHGIYIRNAIIEGRLDLESARVMPHVKLVSCIFEGDVNCQDGYFKESLQITRSLFLKEAFFLRLVVEKNAYFNQDIFKGPVNFNWANIGRELSLMEARAESVQASHFEGLEVGKKFLAGGACFMGPTDFRGLKVGYTADFTKAAFHRGAHFERAGIGKNFLAAGAQFLSPSEYASFLGLKVGNLADFDRAVFKGPVDFDQADIGTEFKATEASFENPDPGFEAIGLKVGTMARFNGAVFKGPVKFNGAEVRGQFNAEEARFESDKPVEFNGLRVGDLALFSEAVFRGPALFSGCQVGGLKAVLKPGLVLEGAAFQGEVALNDGKFSDLTLKGAPGQGDLPIALLNLERTTVERDLTLEQVRLGTLKAGKLKVSGQATWDRVAITREADLQQSSINTLVLSRVTWPSPGKDKVFLGGMSYQYVEWLPHSETFADWLLARSPLLNWIENSHFDRRNYLKLQEFFIRTGQRHLADAAYIAMERREVCPQHWYNWLNPWVWLTLIFWDGPVGYGRKPLRIFWVALPFLLAGAALFDIKYLKDVDWPQKNRLFRLAGRVVLSLDKFTPTLLDLGLDKHWQPELVSRGVRVYAFCHRLAGRIFMAVFFVGVWQYFK